MKKIFIIYGVLVFVVIALLIWRFASFDFNLNLLGIKATAKIDNQTIDLLVADTEEELIKGLSGKRSLKENEGMLFIFDQKGYPTFWMKEMNFALDIIYLNDSKVVHIVKNAQPIDKNTSNVTTYSPDEEANHVLEVNAGTVDRLKITEGSTITFEGIE